MHEYECEISIGRSCLLTISTGKEWSTNISFYPVTVSATYYLTVLKTLKQHVLKKLSHLKNQWIQHHDNAKPHSARIMTEYLQKMQISLMPHLPYSLDKTPCEFYLFSYPQKRATRTTLCTVCCCCSGCDERFEQDRKAWKKDFEDLRMHVSRNLFALTELFTVSLVA